MRAKYLSKPISALFLLMALVSCSGGGEKPSAKDATKTGEIKPLSVKVALMEGRRVERSVEAIGTLAAFEEVSISSEYPGTVQKIYKDMGDYVKAGEPLASLDPIDAGLALDEARAALEISKRSIERERALLLEAETEQKRHEELFSQGLVSASRYDRIKTESVAAMARLKEAEARAMQAEARARSSEKRSADVLVKSPISGRVVKKLVSRGESIKDRVPLFTVVSTDVLKFRGTVSEAHVQSIRQGQVVNITLEPYGDRVFKGRVTRVSPAVDEKTRALELEAEVPNPNNVLKPGLFAKGAVVTGVDEGVSFAPERALYQFVGVSKVFVIKDGKSLEKIVSPGGRLGGFIEISGDVSPNDVVAVTNLQNLFDGALVSVEGNAIDKGPQKP